MKRTILTIFVFTFFKIVLLAQPVREVKNISNYDDFWGLIEKITPLKSTQPLQAISLLEPEFKKADDSFVLSGIAQELGELYTTTRQYDKCIAMWEKCFEKKISVFGKLGEDFFPGYVNEYKEFPKFKDALEKNNLLVTEAAKTSTAEYFIQLPVDFKSASKYPLIMLFPGGVGNIQDNVHNWKNDRIKQEYIVAYVQGKSLLFSFARMYGNSGIRDISEIYHKVINDYLIDTTNVILAGMSAGGAM